MPLSYLCNEDFDYYADSADDFSVAEHDCKCMSCGKKIRAGDTVLKFTCYRSADPNSDDPLDIEATENGEDNVYLPDEFHCEKCGEIYLNLFDVGYCLSSSDYMPGLLDEYQEMTGFKKMRQIDIRPSLKGGDSHRMRL